MWISTAIPAPPLVDSTVLVAAITTVGAIVVGMLAGRKRSTEASPPPAPRAESDRDHDDIVEILIWRGGVDSKLRRDYERLNTHEERLNAKRNRLNNHQDRLRALERRLGLEPSDDL